MGGMIKHNCEDPEDEGEFCWSKSTQGLVLGSYFWGYTAQFLAIFLAKRVLGSLIHLMMNVLMIINFRAQLSKYATEIRFPHISER